MWKCMSGEVTGRSHRKEGLPCQDKTYYAEENGVIAIALADGAGSASLSQFGAKCVVRTAVHYVLHAFEDVCSTDCSQVVMEEFLKILREALGREATVQGCDFHQLASTLLLVAVKGDKAFVLHIGDGIISRIRDDELQVISKPMNGEFANETYFVTDENALAGMEILRGTNVGTEAFILMSDGAGDNFYDKGAGQLVPIIKEIIEDVRETEGSEKGERKLDSVLRYIAEQNTHDDCSLAVLIR